MMRASALPLLLLACAGEPAMPAPRYFGAGATAPRRGGTLVYGVTDDVRTLDPAIAYDELSIYAGHYLFDTLLGFAPATAPDPMAVVPQLAERWEVSADGLVYTFHLREASFSDGQPVVAQDFVYALDRILSPEVGCPGAHYYTGIAGARERLEGKADRVAGLVAKDPRTLEIRLTEPDGAFPLLLALKFSTPQKRVHVEAVGERIRDTPLGTGPFVLKEWRQGEKIVFARNPRYWRPEVPYLDAIELHLLVSRDVAMLKFQRGEFHTMDRLSEDDHRRLIASPAWRPYVYHLPQVDYYAELMNTRVRPFDDKRVRQAMNYAVNKEDTIRLNGRRAVVAHGVLPPAMPGHDPTRAPYPYDPERARRLLAEAGYPDGFEITYVTLNDPLQLKLTQSLQADLAKVGVRMKIQVVTFPVYLTAGGKGEIVFGYTAWVMDFPDPSNFLETKFHSRQIAPENSTNDSFYSNPEVDRLLDAARREPDREKRLALYRRADAIVFDDAPVVFHYHSVRTEVRQPFVMGYTPHPVWIRDFREVWLDEPRRAR